MHEANRAQIGVVGGSGYSGVELTKLLAGHPGVELRFLASDRWVGEPVSKRLSLDGPVGKLRYAGLDEAEALAAGCDAVLLATPAEASLALAPKLLAQGAKVVDLSGAFRLRDAALYPPTYGFEHVHAGLLASAVYGMPELCRDGLAGAKLVANPGCFATAATLALAPLMKAGLLAPERLIVDAASGVTGAGRKAAEDYSFSEIDEDFRAYRILRHQHTPEIAQSLGGAKLTFTAHLLPIKRGILATCHAELARGVDAAAVAAAFERAYGREPFVRLLESPEQVTLKSVVGSNACALGFAVGSERELIVVSALDNLVKGAAGQAVQNLNLLLGFEETAGLSGLKAFYP